MSGAIAIEAWHRAADFAARQHQGQFRKDGRTPYFAHPCRVALTVAAVFGCPEPEVLAAAMLHDTIEDTTTDYEDIEGRFGAWVARAVAALTDLKALPDAEREEDYHGRLMRADWRVLLIKLADVYDNVSDSFGAGGAGNADLATKNLRKSGKVVAMIRKRAGESEALARAVGIVEDLRRRAGTE